MPTDRTNLGPLTTVWKYPNSCTTPVQACSTCDRAWEAQKCGDNEANTQGVLDNTRCWPPRDSDITGGNAVNGWGFYSPAYNCPQGYTPACSATGPEINDFEFQFSIQSDETVRGCCPIGYTCNQPGGPQTCISLIARGSLQVASCSAQNTILSTLDLPETFREGKSTVTLNRVTLFAPMFQLNWKSTDRSLFTATATATSTVVPGSESNSSGGLSTGAQAGIGVGVGVVGLGILGAAFYLWRRRRKTKSVLELDTMEQNATDQKPAGGLATSNSSPPPHYQPAELDGNTRHEM